MTGYWLDILLVQQQKLLPRILLKVLLMCFKILDISIHQRMIAIEYQKVFSILLFRNLGKIEGALKQRTLINNDDLVIRNGSYASIRHLRVSQKISSSVFFSS